jgi:phosphoenolpyruvate carboxykinase (ATP)
MMKAQVETNFGLFNIDKLTHKIIYRNLSTPLLVEHIIKNAEGKLSSTGVVMVRTGEFTGRSPGDKFIVNHNEDSDKEIIWGKVNQPISSERFDNLLRKLLTYLQDKNLYIQEVLVGKDPDHTRKIRIISELAWSALFSKDLFIESEQTKDWLPDFTVIQAPGFKADPLVDGTTSGTFIVIDFSKRLVLIGNTQYAGEIKKSIFTVMNRLLTSEGVLPMHCSANVGKNRDSALFFGLSGTGKTTLSSDPNRVLIGDDEHGWSERGIFNFEGGCYAKTINLNRNYEPLIWDAANTFGSVLENVVFDDSTRVIDFTDDNLTENTRAAYSLSIVPKRVENGLGGHPKNIFFLSADAFGVLPPISLLTPDQATYYFLAGYTSKLAGTERGLGIEPQATFSTCFGAPFLPLSPIVYKNMFEDRIITHNSRVWLVNTGWIGGRYGVGKRIELPYTRALITAAIDDTITEFCVEPFFNLRIPSHAPNVPDYILNPVNSWADASEYKKAAKSLTILFEQNHQPYK